MGKFLFTSESVTAGHPDKVSDSVSDAILDAIIAQDPKARVACETFCTTGVVTVMGEITTTAKVDIPKVVRKTVCERYVLNRTEKTMDTAYGPVRVKTSTGDGTTRTKVEYDDIARIAKEQNRSLRDIREELKL